jgi:hypothetical protein
MDIRVISANYLNGLVAIILLRMSGKHGEHADRKSRKTYRDLHRRVRGFETHGMAPKAGIRLVV